MFELLMSEIIYCFTVDESYLNGSFNINLGLSIGVSIYVPGLFNGACRIL